MSQPAIYNRVTSFTTDQAQAPATPLAGANFDAELNAVKTTLDQVLTNLAIIQRDDTHLANASVGVDQFDTTVVIGFNLPTAWVTGHSYAVTSDAVFNGVKLYRCLLSHTSGTFATDLAAGKWTLLADFTPAIANASNVTFTPAQGLASTNVQAAIVEHKVITDDITGFRADISGGYTTAGTNAAYVLATGTPFTSLAAMNNQPITFIPHATSAAAATLAVDGLAAKKIRTATGVDLTVGALLIGTPYQVVYYNGVGEFILTGYSEVFNNVTINGTLGVVGAQTYTGAAVWNGTTTFNNTAAFGAGGSMAGTFTGAPTFSGSLVFSASPQFSGLPSFLNVTRAFSLTGSTTANRSGSPSPGDVRYNTTLNGLEYWNGTVWIVMGQQPTVQRFTSGTAATYTAPAGVVRQRVRIWGPGAGGGAQATNAGSPGSADTSFQVNATGTAWTAVKGSGGPSGSASTTGGAGGTGGTDGSTGTLINRVAGARGSGSSTSGTAAGGAGGGTGIGPGAQAAQLGAAGVAAPANDGGGGSGGNGPPYGGGGGGGEYAEFWVTGMTTALYTIGLGGAGGAAGTLAGGNGANGGAIIEEFYS